MVLARQLLARQIVRHDAVRNHTLTSSLRNFELRFSQSIPIKDAICGINSILEEVGWNQIIENL